MPPSLICQLFRVPDEQYVSKNQLLKEFENLFVSRQQAYVAFHHFIGLVDGCLKKIAESSAVNSPFELLKETDKEFSEDLQKINTIIATAFTHS